MSETPYPDEIPLLIPPSLQSVLENDCIEITQKKKLVELPVTLSVESILKNFFLFVRAQNEDGTNYSLLIEVLDGLKIYFDHTLQNHLLYQEEKSQYQLLVLGNEDGHVTQSHVMSNGIADDVITHDSGSGTCNNRRKDPSSVYGAVHLLRLFVKLPQFLSYARVPINHVHILHHYLKDFFSYLSSNIPIFGKYI